MKYTGTEQSVYCRCGAQWHGRYTQSGYIARHALKCGAPVTRTEFAELGHHARRLPHWKDVERWGRRAIAESPSKAKRVVTPAASEAK